MLKSTKGKERQSTAGESPVGGMSTKTLISNMKRALNSSDTDEDGQEHSTDGLNSLGSPVLGAKVLLLLYELDYYFMFFFLHKLFLTRKDSILTRF